MGRSYAIRASWGPRTPGLAATQRRGVWEAQRAEGPTTAQMRGRDAPRKLAAVVTWLDLAWLDFRNPPCYQNPCDLRVALGMIP